MIVKIPHDKERKKNYVCDDCKETISTFSSYEKARADGWAISRSRKYCYCPKCAPYHRNVGCAGAEWL